jgi:hypothetical protein
VPISGFGEIDVNQGPSFTEVVIDIMVGFSYRDMHFQLYYYLPTQQRCGAMVMDSNRHMRNEKSSIIVP